MTEREGEQKGLYKSSYEHDSCGIGFVADISGRKSHGIVKRGLEVLERMAHRGAEGSDNKTGDGSGILMQIPHDFFSGLYGNLPQAGSYGTGLVFLPDAAAAEERCLSIIRKILAEEGLEVTVIREVPVDNSCLGEIALRKEPRIKQIFAESTGREGEMSLELRLYIARKKLERTVRDSDIPGRDYFYLPSFSSRTIVYKGMLAPGQLSAYFADLRNEKIKSAIALVHSRFSTNTFPAWDLAQPFRIVAHNGEINTIKGNRIWMKARESSFESDVFGDRLPELLPVIEPGKSDSASFDNTLEFLVSAGRSIPHALMMLIPESWNENNPIPEDLKYFYEYNSTFMEPWDGPASIVFSDGRFVGGTLDRNGLRPSRYVVTRDGLIVMASEAGVQVFSPENVEYKGRLMPGKLLLVDTGEGRIVPDDEIKKNIAFRKPYREWVENNRINLSDLPERRDSAIKMPREHLHRLHLLYRYSRENIENQLRVMVNTGQELTGSMGTDTPLAVFSDKPQSLFNYFKQCFAQVTNPPIDPIREELVMSLTGYIGAQRNLLDETEDHCRMIKFKNPVLSNSDLEKIRNSNEADLKTASVPMLFSLDESLREALERLCLSVEKAVNSGCAFIVLSDRDVNPEKLPIPSLLACSAVHHHLINSGLRMKAGLIIESAEVREVMHFALLFGYGAAAVNPYGIYATIYELIEQGRITEVPDYARAEANYVKAVNKGLLKVISKMGTSTLRSYRGAQLFEAVGLSKEMVDEYFTETDSRIGGIGLEHIREDIIKQYDRAYVNTPELLESEGTYSYRRDGEKHAWNPEAIYLLQWAVRSGDYGKYMEFSAAVDRHNRRPSVIRGLLDFVKTGPVDISEVEPPEEIYKRLTTGAMSFGSLSAEAHETLAAAMNVLGGRSNSGEGGERSERFKKRPDGSIVRSSIKQVASGRFGVTSNYLVNADEIQIKMAQGAKPGEGGQLPGHKVDKIIASTRYSTAGVTLISPPPHHDIYSIEDLAQLIFDLKNVNPAARISVKLVSESGVGTIAAGVAKAHADNIVISGYDGGTGASPVSSIKHAGLPFELGIAEAHQTLLLNRLRSRVRLQTDGQLKNGRDVVIAAMLGAEEFAFGTAALICLGCVMMRKCHLNTCPAGVATQNPELRSKFRGRPEHVINYFTFMVMEIRELMASLGVKKFNDLVGRTDLLVQAPSSHWKASAVDLSSLLYRERVEGGSYCSTGQLHKIDNVLDRKIIRKSKSAIERKTPVNLEFGICNTDRSAGAMLSGEISSRYGDEGLPEGTINCIFRGSAGQSFGAFLAKGVTFRLEGEANDYFGKGLSGGRLIAVPPEGSRFRPEENIIIGNTVLYGATGGEAFVNGIAGERFCVRNSGAVAVVEGTGDHGAEYMTGGRLVVLGRVGRNFAAGMSGGIAYVFNRDGDFQFYCNTGMVELSSVMDVQEQNYVRELIEKHLNLTGSPHAALILDGWHRNITRFIKVIPYEYKRVLHEIKMSSIDKKIEAIRKSEQLEVW